MAVEKGVAELQVQVAELQARLKVLQASISELHSQLMASNRAAGDSDYELPENPRVLGGPPSGLVEQSREGASTGAQSPPFQEILAGDGDVDFGVGFHLDAPDWSWMRQEGILHLPLLHIKAPALFSFSLTCSEEAHYATFPFQLRVYLANEYVRRVIFERSDQSREIQLVLRPAPGMSTAIRLESEGIFVPFLLGLNNDQRSLSVRLSRMRLWPIPGA